MSCFKKSGVGQRDAHTKDLERFRYMHASDQQKIKQLEEETKKIGQEKNQLSKKLKQTQIDLQNARSERMQSGGCKQASNVSLLESKIADLGNKIDAILCMKESEMMEQKTYLFNKLSAVLSKIRLELKEDMFAGKWETDDVKISLTYFEKAVCILNQDIPQFEMMLEAVAQYNAAARNEVKQVSSNFCYLYVERSKFSTH